MQWISIAINTNYFIFFHLWGLVMSTTSSLRHHWCWADAARIDTTRPDTARSHVISSDYLVQPQQQSCVQRQKRWFEDEEKTLEATWKSNKNMLDAHNNHANHAAWVLIWEVVNVMSKGTSTTDQCKSKIKRLKKDYRKAKDSNKISGVAPMSCSH